MVLTHNHALFHTYLFCLSVVGGGGGRDLNKQPKHMPALLFLTMDYRVNKGHRQKERQRVTISTCNN